MKTYHILNGEALKNQLPNSIKGEIIVARECLVDGDVDGSNLVDLYKTRASFIANNYPGYKEGDYYEKTVSEFERIMKIPNESEINLWFEDDLFCQVNFWFIAHLLNIKGYNGSIFLIRPYSNIQFGFGGMDEKDFSKAYKEKVNINLFELHVISKLWTCYQKKNHKSMFSFGKGLENKYPFILNAIKVNHERQPINNTLGRPMESIIKIMNNLKSDDFDTVFKYFNKEESIYGFGDLQVKRLFNKVKKNYIYRLTF
ncbi:MAG: DUF1835 domain-containing protein [Polaribacter sp.]|uniref:DUF1835 domain-containing protein n=1 Tax=Polaribacter sp. TaxID=1920175 RepID=UPI003BAF8DC9